MAIFNESLTARFNAVIRRLHSMKGRAPAPQIAPEIGHHIVLENDRPEHHYLAQSSLCWGTATQVAGGAGTLAVVQLFNPAGSGILVVIEQITVWSKTTLGTISVAVGNTPMTNNNFNARFRDTRLGFVQIPAAQLRLDTPVAQSGQVVENMNVNTAAASVGPYPVSVAEGIVLAPGTGVWLTNLTANEGLAVAYRWRERPIEPGEV